MMAHASDLGLNTRTMCGAREVMMARTAEGKAFRILTIIDEYTRECLMILTGEADNFSRRYRAAILSVRI